MLAALGVQHLIAYGVCWSAVGSQGVHPKPLSPFPLPQRAHYLWHLISPWQGLAWLAKNAMLQFPKDR
eukprot:scaffold500197_cov35-Prasinocladus_malaysianus.AAC.1